MRFLVLEDLDVLVSKLTKVTLVKDHQKVCLEAVKPSLFKKVHIQIDFCLLATHGTSGEDGMLQGYLELLIYLIVLQDI